MSGNRYVGFFLGKGLSTIVVSHDTYSVFALAALPLVRHRMSTKTRAFWLEGPGTGCIREEILPSLERGWCRIETECCGISPGTERLVAMGRVPVEARSAMRCQYMAGDFAFPLSFGYSLVGRCVEGPPALKGRGSTSCTPTRNVAMRKSTRSIPFRKASLPYARRWLPTSKRP